MADYYQTLGVSRDADEKTIKQAYRSLARKHHPDLNPGDEQAEARFKKINEAHEVLSKADSRKKYDRYGEDWRRRDEFVSRGHRGASGFPWDINDEQIYRGPFDDLDDLLGRRGRRRDAPAAKRRIEGSFEVALEQAFAGTTSQVTFGPASAERRIEVTIPPGVDTGSVVHVSPDPNSDLYLTIIVTPHRRFQRRGDDLYVEVEVPVEDAVLGGDAEVLTLKGKVSLKVPEGSQNGQRIRLSGQGMPRLNNRDNPGDLYITLRPTLPKVPTDQEKELFRSLKELRASKKD